jgi:hypothetical protein
MALGAAGNMAAVQTLFQSKGVGGPSPDQQRVLDDAAAGRKTPVMWDQQGRAHYYIGKGDYNDAHNWTQ